MRELRLFFTALTFYTRLPGLGLADVSGDGLSRATRYFPLVGIIVGALAAATYWGAQLLFPVGVAVVLSMATSIWVTGAFHAGGGAG